MFQLSRNMSSSIFNVVPRPRFTRSRFNLGYENLLSMDAGKLVPTMCKECFPGDTWKIGNLVYCKMMPMLAPVFENMQVYTYFFFVPNRILWKYFESWITRREDNNGQLLFPFAPNAAISDILVDFYSDLNSFPENGTLFDFLNIIPRKESSFSDLRSQVTLWRMLAYSRIYADYFADENFESDLIRHIIENIPSSYEFLTDEIMGMFPSSVNGLNTGDGTYLYDVNYKKDYFTSALPFRQKGTPTDLGNLIDLQGDVLSQLYMGNVPNNNADEAVMTGTNGSWKRGADGPEGTIRGTLQNVTASGLDINQLRYANAIQLFKERNARGGSYRYKEFLQNQFGVTSQDARLQRAEFIGGSRQDIITSEVLQQSGSTQTSALGDYAGHGVSAGGSKIFKYHCYEHGYIMGISFIRTKARYFQGIPRDLLRLDSLDVPTPVFANLGEQAIKNVELFLSGDIQLNDEIFGYTPQYADIKVSQPEIHGQFKTSLSYWHLARIFKEVPRLGEAFIKQKPEDFARIFAVTDSNPSTSNKFLFDIQNILEVSRTFPKFGVPKLIG